MLKLLSVLNVGVVLIAVAFMARLVYLLSRRERDDWTDEGKGPLA